MKNTKVIQLLHGAIYLMTTGECARCNICYQGTEVWYTDKSGKCVGGKPVEIISHWDDSYKNYDVVDKEVEL